MGSRVELKEMAQITKIYANLLKNEHYFQDEWTEVNEGDIINRLNFFAKRGYVSLSEDNLFCTITDAEFLPLLQFMGDIVQPILDTYFSVLIVIEQIAGKHLALREDTLI